MRFGTRLRPKLWGISGHAPRQKKRNAARSTLWGVSLRLADFEESTAILTSVKNLGASASRTPSFRRRNCSSSMSPLGMVYTVDPRLNG